jgi:selenocysteine lyase/cysteine desulfurase
MIRHAQTHSSRVFRQFREGIEAAIANGTLADGLIGKGLTIEGPFGPVPLLYADYAASGRALVQVEHLILHEVLPFYANPHTQASFCGRMINALRAEARREIAAACKAGSEEAVIFTGGGATAGLQKLVRLFAVDRAERDDARPLVLLGPYEHHSNLLPWRESGAEVIELHEDPCGGPDRARLAQLLASARDRRVVCSFSAGSNVTGALTDVVAISRLVKAHGALLIWDHAGSAPYLPLSMHPAPDVHVDALVFSPHKFIGGPAASGVLIVRRAAVALDRPSAAGGGTVSFVSPATQDYLPDVQAREEAGTPNAIGDIRAALAIMVHDELARAGLQARAVTMRAAAWAELSRLPGLELLGTDRADTLPILSFRLRDREGELVHHQLVTRLLSDRYGIQARGGCACAGPYVHQLLKIDVEASDAIRSAIMDGQELEKPGFVRINFSPLMNDQEFERLVGAIIELARDIGSLRHAYSANPGTAIFEPVAASIEA